MIRKLCSVFAALAFVFTGSAAHAAIATYSASERISHDGAFTNIESDGRALVRTRTSDYPLASQSVTNDEAVIDVENAGAPVGSYGGIESFDVYNNVDFTYRHQISWIGLDPTTNPLVTLTAAKLSITAYGANGNNDGAGIAPSVTLSFIDLEDFLLGTHTTTETTIFDLGDYLATVTASFNGGLVVAIDKDPNSPSGAQDKIRIVASQLDLTYEVIQDGGGVGEVPEPATLAIWGLGLGIAGLVRLRRKTVA